MDATQKVIQIANELKIHLSRIAISSLKTISYSVDSSLLKSGYFGVGWNHIWGSNLLREIFSNYS